MFSNSFAIRTWMPGTSSLLPAALSTRTNSAARMGGPIHRNKIFFFGGLSGDASDARNRYRRNTRPLSAGPCRQSVRSSRSLLPSAKRKLGTDERERRLSGPASFRKSWAIVSLPANPTIFAGCSNSAACVLPHAIVPQSAWAAPGSQSAAIYSVAQQPRGSFSTSPPIKLCG